MLAFSVSYFPKPPTRPFIIHPCSIHPITCWFFCFFYRLAQSEHTTYKRSSGKAARFNNKLFSGERGWSFVQEYSGCPCFGDDDPHSFHYYYQQGQMQQTRRKLVLKECFHLPVLGEYRRGNADPDTMAGKRQVRVHREIRLDSQLQSCP